MEPISLVLAVFGIAAGFGASQVTTKRKLGSAADAADKELKKAKKEGDKALEAAREEAKKLADEARADEAQRRKELKSIEQKLLDRQVSLDKKLDELDKRADNLRKSEDEVESLKNEIRTIRTKQQEKLEKVAKLTKSDAADHLMKMTEKDIKNDLVNLVSKLQNEAKENAEEKAGAIIVEAMERMASEVTAERTVTSIKLEGTQHEFSTLEGVVEDVTGSFSLVWALLALVMVPQLILSLRLRPDLARVGAQID